MPREKSKEKRNVNYGFCSSAPGFVRSLDNSMKSSYNFIFPNGLSVCTKSTQILAATPVAFKLIVALNIEWGSRILIMEL